MPRRKAVMRNVYKTVCLEEDIIAQVELKLWSELEKKVPFGAWKIYLTDLIWADLQRDRNVNPE